MPCQHGSPPLLSLRLYTAASSPHKSESRNPFAPPALSLPVPCCTHPPPPPPPPLGLPNITYGLLADGAKYNCRLQRDQAAHAHSSNRQLGDELVEAQAQLSQQAGRLAKETDRRRHLEALLDEGLQVQSQILLGLQVGQLSSPNLSHLVAPTCL